MIPATPREGNIKATTVAKGLGLQKPRYQKHDLRARENGSQKGGTSAFSTIDVGPGERTSCVYHRVTVFQLFGMHWNVLKVQMRQAFLHRVPETPL